MSISAALLLVAAGVTATAQQPAAPACAAPGECLCDNSYEDCRAPILELIANEHVGIDVSIWFMNDARYSNALIARSREGLPIRVIVDTEADASYAGNRTVRDALIAAKIPVRDKVSTGINHWKAMLFAGQRKVQFSAANYANGSFSPIVPYTQYVDEAIYFTDDPDIVNSFMQKFDDHWVDTTNFRNLANITSPLARNYPTYAVHPDMNFVPDQHFENRLRTEVGYERQRADAVIFRITSAKIPDALIALHQAGVQVRLITEEEEYRNPGKLWHAYNVDRMYAAGIPIKVKDNVTEQDVHQKSIVLYSRERAPLATRGPMVVFGSSNWTTSSSNSQREHNYFTRKPWMVTWFAEQFERKWNNRKVDGTPIGQNVFIPLTPLPPATPAYVSPANDTVGLDTSVTLTWEGGDWAHKYDIYVDTTPNFTTPVIGGYLTSHSTAGIKSTKESYAVHNLIPGTTYYWRIVSKTMADVPKEGPTWRFTTAGVAPPPPPPPISAELGPGDILLHASRATTVGGWSVMGDSQAVGGARLASVDAGQPKVTTAAVAPADYFELSFTAEAGRPYRIWIRGSAHNDYYGNDSVHVQFSESVDASGAPLWRIGTQSATWVSVEQGNGAGLSGWGWSDNGWDSLGPTVYFAYSGVQTIRVQRREDGMSIDQVLLSPEKFMTAAPGAAKNDATYFPESDGTGTPPPPPPPPAASSPLEQVLHMTGASITGTEWRLVADPSAASGIRLENPDAGLSKASVPEAMPSSYAEISFTAEANIAYRLWVRLRATGDKWANDSLHVQFSDAVTANGTPVARIGSSSSASVNLEDCSGCGLSGWGWQDNGWGIGVMGPVLYFATTGPQTLRLQRREDGVQVDQIVLSTSTYMNAPPGALKNDATLLPESGADEDPEPDEPPDDEHTPPAPSEAGDVVLHAASGTITGADWQFVADPSAAGGTAATSHNLQRAKVKPALAAPASYVEVAFIAEPGRPYRLWVRMRAEEDDWANDSVHVQFSGSLNESNQPAYQIGTDSSADINLEDCSGCGLSGWGWQDNGWGVDVMGPTIRFAAEYQTLRVQVREDGVRIDQIVLSPFNFLSSSPGALKNDTTILPASSTDDADDEASQTP